MNGQAQQQTRAIVLIGRGGGEGNDRGRLQGGQRIQTGGRFGRENGSTGGGEQLGGELAQIYNQAYYYSFLEKTDANASDELSHISFVIG